MGNGYIIQHDVEPQRAPHQIFADESRDHFALCDELARVELGDDALEDLVDDGRQHALVVVLAELAVYGRERLDRRPREHAAADVDHLQVCARCRSRQCAGRTAGGRGFLAGNDADAPFVPVRDAITRGFARMSKMMGVSSHGIYARTQAGAWGMEDGRACADSIV